MKLTLSVFKKELKEIFRDKKAIFSLFITPVFIYPLLVISLFSLLMKENESYSLKAYKVGCGEISEELNDYIYDYEDPDITYSFEYVETEDHVQDIKDKNIDAYIFEEDGVIYIEYRSSINASSYCCSYIIERLGQYSNDLSVERLNTEGLDPDYFLNPITAKTVNTNSQEENIGLMLSKLLPMLLLTGIFSGVISPAVDVTAGEIERKTCETTATLPLTGKQLMTGKFFAVAICGILSAILYLLSLSGTGLYLYSVLLSSEGSTTLQLSSFIPPFLIVFTAIIVFSIFISTCVLTICTAAKSSKEANNLSSIFMMLSVVASYIVFLDIDFSTGISFVPVLNMLLLMKTALVMEYSLTQIMITVTSTLLLTVVLSIFLGKLYEFKLKFNDELPSLLERPQEKKNGSVPTIMDGAIVTLLCFISYIYLGSLLGVKLENQGLSLVFSQLILLVLPVIAVLYGRNDEKAVFSLAKKLPVKTGVLMIPLGASVGILLSVILSPLAKVLSESLSQYAEVSNTVTGEMSLLEMWLITALLPAICEEVLFRGYLLSSLKRLKPIWAAIIVSVAFGIFHMNLYQGIYAFLMSLVLCYCVQRTGSIFTSIIIHLVNNSVSVFAGTYLAQLTSGGLLLVCTICIFTLVIALLLTRKHKKI